MIFLSCHASDSLWGIKPQRVKLASTVYRCMTVGFLKELRFFLCPKLMSRQKKSINNTLTSLKFTTFITTRLLQVDDIYNTFRHYGVKKKTTKACTLVKWLLQEFYPSFSSIKCQSIAGYSCPAFWHVSLTLGVQCLTHQQYTMNKADPKPRPLDSRVQLSTQTIRPLWPSLTVLLLQFIPSWCDLCRHQTSSFPVFPRPIMVFDLDINMIKDVVHPAFIELGLKQKT